MSGVIQFLRPLFQQSSRAIIALAVVMFMLVVESHGKLLRVSPSNFGPAIRMQTSIHASRQQQDDTLQQRPKTVGLAKVLSYFGGSVPKQKTKLAAAEIKVVTDIDDTIVSSGGVKLFGFALGGIDNLYRRGQFYPGAVQFLFELSCPPGSTSYSKLSYSNANGTIGSSLLSPFHLRLPARVAVLTARAREFKFALALKASHKVCKAFANIGATNGLPGWGIGDVYYGSVAEWIFQQRKGLRKFANFEVMLERDDKLDSENNSEQKKKRQYIMVGDTGEKDEEAAERIASRHPDRLRAVFLHQVYTFPTIKSSSSSSASSTVPASRPDRKVNGVPFYYFRTYVGAAAKAQRVGIINNEAVQRVTEQALDDLHDLDELLPPLDGKKVKVIKKKESLLGMLYKEVSEARTLRWQEIARDAKTISSLKVKF